MADYYKKTIKLAWCAMATGSLSAPWVSTLNATTLHYRAITVQLEKGLPMLVGNALDVVRVVGGPAAHRRADNFGKEFSLRPDPSQPNNLAKAIGITRGAVFLKSVDEPADIPSVNRYMYLTHAQEWRGWATDEHTQNQCDVLPVTPDAPSHFGCLKNTRLRLTRRRIKMSREFKSVRGWVP